MSYVFKYRWWEIFLATLALGVIFGFVWYVPVNNRLTVTPSEVPKVNEYSVGGKVTAITDKVITFATVRIVAGSSGNYTTSVSKEVSFDSNTPVVLLSLKDGQVTQIKSSISAIKIGSNISVTTHTPPDSISRIVATSIQISQ